MRSLAEGLSTLRSKTSSKEFDVIVATNTNGTDDETCSNFRVRRRPTLFQLWRLIRWSDVVQVAGPALAPLVLSRVARKPTVVEHHGYQAVCPNGLLLHQPDRTICPGHFQARRYSKCLDCLGSEMPRSRALAKLLLMFLRSRLCRKAAKNLGITQHVVKRQALPQSSVIYYGVEECPEADVSTISTDDTAPVPFAYVGRFVPEKGLQVLVQATAILRAEGYNLDVRMIGDGPERSNIEAMIAAHGLDSCMRITGYQTGAALVDALRDLRVVIMPSIWEETAGLSAIEQMMRGRLVIAADVGGLSEVVGDSGLKFPPGNSEALANLMRRVLQNPSLIESLGRKARGRARLLFHRARMVEDHAAVYRLVTKNKATTNQMESR